MPKSKGFTLIEILIVVGILVMLTLFIVMAFRGNEGQKVRDAGRITQAALLGARDRALHAKSPRGIRIVRDPTNTNVGIGFVYLQRLDYLTYGPNAISLERIDIVSPTGGPNDADGPDVKIVRGIAGNDWFSLKDFFGSDARIRIPSQTGTWYAFQYNTTGPNALTQTNPVLQLTAPYIDPGAAHPAVVAHPTTSTIASCDIDIGNEILPNHAPIDLTAGTVIDLANSSTNAQEDLMFSPRGMLTGPVAALGPIHLLLRDGRDVAEGIDPRSTTAVQRDVMIITLFPQTGNVQSFPVDLTDANADNLADDLFKFAKLGSVAGG